MKQKNLTRLSQQYETTLAKLLKQGPGANLQPALKLGHAALALGLNTLELARMHDRAMLALGLADVKNAFTKLANIFFTGANAPIAATSRAAQQGQARLNRSQATLGRRTAELATSNRELKRGVARHKIMADAAAKHGRHHDKCLEESLELQKRLRQLTHRVMLAQENERTYISHELQDEIAQTLLGINVRLLSLKRHARSNTRGLKEEITSTQRLVVKSARSVREFARELEAHHPPPASPAGSPDTNGSRKNKSAPGRPGRSFPVIAMAASVGGLKALSVILGGLPADFPAAIAIVMHLAPDHKSLLAEILKCRTDLPVKQAHTGDVLAPSHIFIAPPNHHLFVVPGGRLELSSAQADKIHFARPSAEPLFASVAQLYKKNAIAVVLTGGDGDGSFGVQIIKENGGMVIAQDRPTSENFSMPQTSINTGDVDFILPLTEIAPMLIALVWGGHNPASRPALPKMATPHFAARAKTVMLKL